MTLPLAHKRCTCGHASMDHKATCTWVSCDCIEFRDPRADAQLALIGALISIFADSGISCCEICNDEIRYLPEQARFVHVEPVDVEHEVEVASSALGFCRSCGSVVSNSEGFVRVMHDDAIVHSDCA